MCVYLPGCFTPQISPLEFLVAFPTSYPSTLSMLRNHSLPKDQGTLSLQSCLWPLPPSTAPSSLFPALDLVVKRYSKHKGVMLLVFFFPPQVKLPTGYLLSEGIGGAASHNGQLLYSTAYLGHMIFAMILIIWRPSFWKNFRSFYFMMLLNQRPIYHCIAPSAQTLVTDWKYSWKKTHLIVSAASLKKKKKKNKVGSQAEAVKQIFTGLQITKKAGFNMSFPLICRGGWGVVLAYFPPSVWFYHILKAMLEGPINGFWLSPSVQGLT